jgi:Tfp pilus assembly protein PilO
MPLEYKGSLSRYRKYLQMVKNQPLVRASLWVIFSLVLTITMILSALKPTLSTIAALAGQIEQQEKISNQMDEKIRTVQTAARNLDKVRSEVPLLDQAMPVTPQWKDLANRLEMEATASGIKLTSLVISEIPVKGKYIIDKVQNTGSRKTENLPAGVQKTIIDLDGMGNYTQLRELVSRLQKMRRLIIITNMTIDKNENNELVISLLGYAIFNIIDRNKL